MPDCAIRVIEGLTFNCPSPSVWHLIGEPVTIAFDGGWWVLSLIDRQGRRREGHYHTRQEAIAHVVIAFNGRP